MSARLSNPKGYIPYGVALTEDLIYQVNIPLEYSRLTVS